MSFRELVLTDLCTVLNLWILQFKRGSSVEKLPRDSYLLSDWEDQSSFYFFNSVVFTDIEEMSIKSQMPEVNKMLKEHY